MGTIDIDAILGLENNRRDKTAGFVGNRLFAEWIEDTIGFVGAFGVFHDCRRERLQVLEELLPIALFRDSRAEQVLRYDWYPTHIKRLVKCHFLDYVERKTISRDDVAVSEVTVTNRGPHEELIAPRIGGDPGGELMLWGQTVSFRRAATAAGEIRLAPGQSRRIVFAMAIGLSPVEAEGNLRGRLTDASMDEIIDEEKSFYRENTPEFHCDDPLVERTYYYRQYVLRHNACLPAAGFLRHPVFYEGRTVGYARLITASASLALDESRWWRNPQTGYGEIRTLVESLPEHGIFRDVWVNRVRELSWPGYEEWIPRAMADFLLVHPHADLARDVREAGYRNIVGLLREKDKNHNLMLNPGGHHMTQEHSPAFTYFHEYRDWYDYTDLERIEYQAFFYGSVTAVAALLQAARDPRSSEIAGLAADLRQRTLASMWHREDEFFYAIREADGVHARCKEADGFLAFLYGLAPFEEPYTRIFRYFLDDHMFWNPYPISSCAKDIPVYTPHQRMWGDQRKAQGCTWAGPTWPYLNSLLVNVLAGLLRSGATSAIEPAHLRNFFQVFTQGHLENGIPMVRENWDGLNGAQRGCPDYLHATYIDLVVRHLMGFEPEAVTAGAQAPALSPLLGVNAEMKGLPCAGALWDLEVDAAGRGRITPVDRHIAASGTDSQTEPPRA